MKKLVTILSIVYFVLKCFPFAKNKENRRSRVEGSPHFHGIGFPVGLAVQ
jgi:hypothetical protein